MTKHNGKARKAGERVGAALAAMNKKTAPTTQAAISAAFKHTTDTGPNMQSVLDRNDLDELMAMADLADRDFTAERGSAVVVVSTGVVDPLAEARREEERAAAEAQHAHRLALPRRPAWSADMTAEQLDHQERTAFLAWRRNLAQLEEQERLVLTPFEKNLEVWRQLWRVLERSDIVVQVVDARDPLLYRSEDLESYARELHSSKSSLLLLNKADLLPPHVRSAWADYFDQRGVEYAFWSAQSVIAQQQALRSEAAALGLGLDAPTLRKLMHEQHQQQQKDKEKQQQQQQQGGTGGSGGSRGGEEDGEEGESGGAAAAGSSSGRGTAGAAGTASTAEDPRIRILDVDDLLELFERKCAEAQAAAAADGVGGGGEGPGGERRHMVGLVGYPNVGKSSTINALFGAKKTAVAPTPGKTKHFQTLHVSPEVVLCDCPGLVLPKFAKSRAEMVAAGVIPIDRLTEIRQPIDVVATRVGRQQLQAVYGIKLPPPPRHMPPDTPPTGEQVLRCFAILRGWTAGRGLPDETRAGRQLLRDYTAGKLVFCLLPPGSTPASWVPGQEERMTKAPAPRPGAGTSPAPAGAVPKGPGGTAAAGAAERGVSGPGTGVAEAEGSGKEEDGEAGQGTGAAGAAAVGEELDAADLDLLQELGLGPKQAKQKRPEYKFNKKAPRTKGYRGQLRAEGGYDGAGMVTGKKGGLVRVGGY